MKKLLNGVDKELRPTASVKLLVSLKAFRKRLDPDSTPRRRKRFQRDLNALLNSNIHLRAAAKRYLSKETNRHCKTSAALEKRVDRLIKQLERKGKTRVK
ncbi:MAG TPA: hypothetical protein VGR81_01010 [Candidatus Acidoferrales bacterium]|nr:hypothetical protein [Candidatus Acidoferrales bacterium]